MEFPNLNHLYYFHVVATEGSLKRAADALDVTQPTISAQIKQLEDYLGTRLFQREAAGMRLNDAGQRAYDFTAVMFRATQRLLESFAPERAEEGVTLEVGVTSAVTHTFAAEYFLPLFGKPGIFTRIRHGDYNYLLHDLVSHELDILLSDAKPTHPRHKGIDSQPVHRPTLIAVAAPPLASKVETFPRGLSRLPFMHYTVRSQYRWEIDQYFVVQGIAPNAIAESDDIAIMVAAAVDGIGFAIVPSSIARAPLEDGSLVELGHLEGINTTVYAHYQRLDPPQAVLEAVEALRQNGAVSDPEDVADRTV